MTSRQPVLIVRTGTANIASVHAALRRLNVDARCAESPDELDRAQAVVLPGVGTLAAAMNEIGRQNLIEPLQTRLRDGRPTLAICLGFQMLFEGSDESPDVAGLGVIEGRITPLPPGVRSPHIGWNDVTFDDGWPEATPGKAYFAHSYRAERVPPEWQVAHTEHGGRFISAVRRSAVTGFQFHPELSGSWGRAMIARWLAKAGVIERDDTRSTEKHAC